jgi:hypothetical protein
MCAHLYIPIYCSCALAPTHVWTSRYVTCAGELEELALALETELEPLAAQELAEVLEMIRSSGSAGDIASTRAKAVRRVADKCWWFVTAARGQGQGGFLWGGTPVEKRLAQPQRPLRILVLS